MLQQHPGGLALTKQLLAACSFQPGTKVLDIGCGRGTTVEYLQEVCQVHAVGIDVSEERLAQGRDRNLSLQLIQAAAENLPFPDATFDGVIAECSLSVMVDARAVLAEIRRVLVLGGTLGVTDVYKKTTGGLPGADGEEWKELAKCSGFALRSWEDCSSALREFVACYIMEYGSTEGLCQWGKKEKGKLGYFLLVAEQCHGKE